MYHRNYARRFVITDPTKQKFCDTSQIAEMLPLPL